MLKGFLAISSSAEPTANSGSLPDLFLNRNLIKENAFKYKKTLVEEFQLVLIHGLLHLVGFSHKEEDKLKKIENQILNKVWGNGQ